MAAPPPKAQFETVTLHADQSFAMVRAGDGRLLAPEVFVDTGPPAASGGYGAANAIVRTADGWQGGVDPRGGGAAIGDPK